MNVLIQARDALGRGDIADAYAMLGGPAYSEGAPLSVQVAGEASSLIRAGLTAEAIDRIDAYLRPGFSGRLRYAATGCEPAR